MARSTEMDREYGSYLTLNCLDKDSQNARILTFMSFCMRGPPTAPINMQQK